MVPPQRKAPFMKLPEWSLFLFEALSMATQLKDFFQGSPYFNWGEVGIVVGENEVRISARKTPCN